MSVIKKTDLFLAGETEFFEISLLGSEKDAVKTIVTTQEIIKKDEEDREINICFISKKEDANILKIANQIYNTAIYLNYPAEKVNWYIHTPAEKTAAESFCQIHMDYKNNSQFTNIKIAEPFKEIPRTIKMIDYKKVKQEILSDTSEKKNFFTRLFSRLNHNN